MSIAIWKSRIFNLCHRREKVVEGIASEGKDGAIVDYCEDRQDVQHSLQSSRMSINVLHGSKGYVLVALFLQVTRPEQVKISASISTCSIERIHIGS